ncbi:hypothetical protein IKW75_03480 [Candidatus Saccharibacteria bacterium]|nr:hypothetical protein [Candidatus Saccharibacteria bacterium]
MLSFEKGKARRVAKSAWEIVGTSRIDSPVVRHRISRGGYHIDIIATNGSNLLVTSGSGSDNGKTLLCANLDHSTGAFTVYDFRDGDWVDTISSALETVQENRNLARQMDFDALVRAKAMGKFSVVAGGLSSQYAGV